MKSILIILASFLSLSALAAPGENEKVLRDEEPLKVQTELRPPKQKFTQQGLEAKVRDNLFKKEEKKEKEQAKSQ